LRKGLPQKDFRQVGDIFRCAAPC